MVLYHLNNKKTHIVSTMYIQIRICTCTIRRNVFFHEWSSIWLSHVFIQTLDIILAIHLGVLPAELKNI